MRVAVVTALAVGAGGFLGALARYGLGGLVQRLVPAEVNTFPFATLVVNLLGCTAIGMFAGYADSRPIFGPEIRAFALIGILGGFTTFSTFGYETFAMMRDEAYFRAALNIVAQVILGLALVWVGFSLTTSR